MFAFIRHNVIRFITPIIWSTFPNQKASALQRFSVVEKDSGLQLYRCIDLIDDPKIKAELFQHVLEEFNHSDLFEELSKSYSNSYLYTPVLPKEYIFKSNASRKEILEFYAYAHVGEEEVNKDFYFFAKSNFDKRIRNVFNRIAGDEARHTVGTDDILIKLCKVQKINHSFLVLKSKTIRLYKQFATYSQSFGHIPLTFFLTLIYFILGPLIFIFIRKRFTLDNQQQFRIFKEQLKEQELVVRK
jgi:hypothetical protein